MKKPIYILFFIALVFTSFQSHEVQKQKVIITFKNVRSNKGVISLSLFKDNKSFDDEKAFKTYIISKKNIKNGAVKASVMVPVGTFAGAVLDDENGDGDMNYNLIGLPKEGYGFTNYKHSGMVKPKIEKFDFTVEKGKLLNLNVEMQYIL